MKQPNKMYLYWISNGTDEEGKPTWVKPDQLLRLIKRDNSTRVPVMIRWQKEKVILYISALKELRTATYSAEKDAEMNEFKTETASKQYIKGCEKMVEIFKQDYTFESAEYEEFKDIKSITKWLDKKMLERI